MQRTPAQVSDSSQGASEARAVLDAVPAMIWRADSEGRCTYLNAAWLEFTGRSIQEELGGGWLEGMHPDDKERCQRTFDAAVREQSEFEIDFRLQRHDGEYRMLADRASPVFSAVAT